MCVDIANLGESCRRLRKNIHKTQKEVAKDLSYSVSSVSAFERGENNNAIILAWYCLNGFDVKRWYNGEK